jgi:hypothetical protein
MSDQSISNVVWSLGQCGARWMSTPESKVDDTAAGNALRYPSNQHPDDEEEEEGRGVDPTVHKDGPDKWNPKANLLQTSAHSHSHSDSDSVSESSDSRIRYFFGHDHDLAISSGGNQDMVSDGGSSGQRQQQGEGSAREYCAQIAAAVERMCEAGTMTEQGLTNTLVGLAKVGLLLRPTRNIAYYDHKFISDKKLSH